jgi:hypothetical protein
MSGSARNAAESDRLALEENGALESTPHRESTNEQVLAPHTGPLPLAATPGLTEQSPRSTQNTGHVSHAE